MFFNLYVPLDCFYFQLKSSSSSSSLARPNAKRGRLVAAHSSLGLRMFPAAQRGHKRQLDHARSGFAPFLMYFHLQPDNNYMAYYLTRHVTSWLSAATFVVRLAVALAIRLALFCGVVPPSSIKAYAVITSMRFDFDSTAVRRLFDGRWTAYQVSDVLSRQRLRSAILDDTWKFDSCAFSVASPSVWNSLPDSSRDPVKTTSDVC